ncbi:zinc metallopeptidase [bacterium 1XD42-8]|nr:zinc metallopeptidase [Lachnospiraceae bacterium]RKJ49993.1 zinc metallopeptidase [bacterium 1XD42-8]
MFMYGMYYYYDPTYFLVIIAALISMIASMRVNSTFQKYSKVRCASGMTGADVARKILRLSGITDVEVEHVSGRLSDHYDPRRKVLRLSDSVFNSQSVAALGVAAHECGHAIQHQKKYAPLGLRSLLVPAASLGSNLGIPLVIAGLIFGALDFLVPIGIWIFIFAVLFQVVTLPVEFNASRRAIRVLGDYGLMQREEIGIVKKVLGAAAMTYVAAAAASVLQLLRLVILAGGRRDN